MRHFCPSPTRIHPRSYALTFAAKRRNFEQFPLSTSSTGRIRPRWRRKMVTPFSSTISSTETQFRELSPNNLHFSLIIHGDSSRNWRWTMTDDWDQWMEADFILPYGWLFSELKAHCADHEDYSPLYCWSDHINPIVLCNSTLNFFCYVFLSSFASLFNYLFHLIAKNGKLKKWFCGNLKM